MRRKFIFFQNSKHIKSEQQNQGVNIFVECIGRREEKSKSQFRCLFSSNWSLENSLIFDFFLPFKHFVVIDIFPQS